MSDIAPGWYKDPVEPTTQRYWDGEGWLGDPIPADATPPDGPPVLTASAPAAPPTSGEAGPAGPTWPAPPAAAAGQAAPPVNAAPPGLGLPPAAGSPPIDGTPPAGTTPGWPAGYPAPGYPPGYLPPGAPPPPGYRPQRVMPAPRPHGLLLAGAGRRLAARVIDVLAVAGLCAIANAWFAYQLWQVYVPWARDALRAQMAGQTLPQLPPSAFNLVIMMCFVATAVWFAYEVPGSANTGQTFGKRLLGIKVMRMESGDRLGFGRAFQRWGRLGLPTLFWWCYGVGFILQAMDCLFVLLDRPLRQALHDKSAGTVVVQIGGPVVAQAADAPRGGTHADPR